MEDTKQRILEKSLELFSTKGYDAVSVGEIAKAVGIKAPSLYNHFPSKQAIFDAILETTTRKTPLRSRSMYRIPKRISRFSPTSQRSCWLKKSDRSSFIRCTIKPSASSAG
mgnify:CR=1 FL=1